MKIKSYKIYESERYYKQILDGEFHEADNHGFVDFDVKYKIILREKFKSIKYDMYYDFSILHYKGNEWRVYQSSDEWFYVREEVEDIMSCPYNTSYINFKCDQIEGLVKFIEENSN